MSKDKGEKVKNYIKKTYNEDYYCSYFNIRGGTSSKAGKAHKQPISSYNIKVEKLFNGYLVYVDYRLLFVFDEIENATDLIRIFYTDPEDTWKKWCNGELHLENNIPLEITNWDFSSGNKIFLSKIGDIFDRETGPEYDWSID